MVDIGVLGCIVGMLWETCADEEHVVYDDHLSKMGNTRKKRLMNTLDFWIFSNIFF